MMDEGLPENQLVKYRKCQHLALDPVARECVIWSCTPRRSARPVKRR